MEYIANRFGLLVNRFTSFINLFKSIFSSIGDFFSAIGSFITGLWFGFTTLCNGIWSSIVSVFESNLWSHVVYAFNVLVNFIGFPGAIFISTLLFIVIVRIGIAFVFKIFRLNVDYKN